MARDLSFLFPELMLASTVVLMLVAEMLRAPRLALTFGLIGLGLSTALTWPLLEADTSVFGEDTYLYNGVRLSLPLGNIPYTSISTSAELIAAPFGRDNGQTIQKPVDLYDLTEAFSLQHMSSHWGDIIN